MSASSETWSDEYGGEDEEDSQDRADQDEKPAAARKRPPEGPTAYMKRVEQPQDEDEVKLWLITFTDVIALMLTFFVMLYAMSVPEEDKWEEVSTALSSQFTKKFAEPYRAGPQETISIDKIDLTRALSLPYLKSLLEQTFREREITNFSITQLSDRLVIALPDDILRTAEQPPSSAQPAPPPQESKTRAAMVILADTIARIKNRIEIIGHGATWEQSMDNGLRAALIFRQTGYTRDIITRAAAPPGQGAQAPDSNSIDIVILRDNGLERELLVIE